MSNRHCKFYKSKTKPPPHKSPLKLAHPGVSLIWFMAAPFFQCPGPDLAVIFHTSPSLTPHVHSISESCWIHLRRCPTISHHLYCHHPGPRCKRLPPGLRHWSPSGIACFCPCPPPHSSLFTKAARAPDWQIRSQIKPSVGPHFTKREGSLITTSHNSSTIGFPINSLTSFPTAFSQSSSDPPSQGPNLPSDTPGTLVPQDLHICCVSEWKVCRAPSPHFRSLLKSLLNTETFPGHIC